MMKLNCHRTFNSWWLKLNNLTQKNSDAKKRYWSTIPPDKRSKILSKRAIIAWSKRTKEQKAERSLLMVKARLLKKQKNEQNNNS